MSYQHNQQYRQSEQSGNYGALFNNRSTKTSDRAPDVTGTLTIDGVLYEIVGWDATGKKSGKPYLKIKATPKQPSADNRHTHQHAANGQMRQQQQQYNAV